MLRNIFSKEEILLLNTFKIRNKVTITKNHVTKHTAFLAISQKIRSAPAPTGTKRHRTGVDRQKIARDEF